MEDRDDEFVTPAITRRVLALKEVFLTGEVKDVLRRLRDDDFAEKTAAARDDSPMFRELSDGDESDDYEDELEAYQDAHEEPTVG